MFLRVSLVGYSYKVYPREISGRNMKDKMGGNFIRTFPWDISHESWDFL